MISVENMIAEQCPPVVKKYSLIRKLLLKFLRYLFHESEFKNFSKKYPHLKGFNFVEQVLEYFDFQYSVNDRERECIPVHGPVVIVSNHPIGSLDGLALLKIVGEIRRDVKVVANELLMSIAPLENVLLPVDNMNGATVKKNIKAIDAHLLEGKALIIFPAGEVSRITPSGIKDGRWRNGFLKFAKRARAPIVPIFIDGKNSFFFYSVSILAKPISSIFLISEMFKHANTLINIRIGNEIPYDKYQSLPINKKSVTKLFKRHTYKLYKNETESFFDVEARTIAHPESKVEIKKELKSCETLGETNDGKKILLFQYNGDSIVMREIGRLREISFRAVGEGSGSRRDVDNYDAYYDHIILWDEEDLEIVGAYRLARAASVIGHSEKENEQPLYSQTLFEYQNSASPVIQFGVELGRSFVQPRYWGKRSLDYLWFGIGAYLRKYPEIRYLFGPVSISNDYPALARDKLVGFYRHYFSSQHSLGRAKFPYPETVNVMNSYHGDNYSEDFVKLKQELSMLGVNVPTLYKQYTEICEEGGVEFSDFNVDSNFSDCIDGLIVVDLHRLKPKKKKRYLDL